MLFSDSCGSPLIVVTGPTRSGKSEWAEQLAATRPSVIYIATASGDPADPTWQQRIQEHQQRRPAHWQTREVPIALAATISSSPPQDCLLIDSLGTWLANQLDLTDREWQAAIQVLAQSLHQRSGPIILVAEETGWGIVPAYASGRLFRDRLGQLTRQVSAIADAVYLVVAGYAIDIKQLGTPVPNGT